MSADGINGIAGADNTSNAGAKEGADGVKWLQADGIQNNSDSLIHPHPKAQGKKRFYLLRSDRNIICTFICNVNTHF